MEPKLEQFLPCKSNGALAGVAHPQVCSSAALQDVLVAWLWVGLGISEGFSSLKGSMIA